jgi:hypothetical protein
MILDDETLDAHFTAVEDGRLITTSEVARRLGIAPRKLRPLIQGLEGAATRTRGRGIPPERLWDLATVERLRQELGLPPPTSALR